MWTRQDLFVIQPLKFYECKQLMGYWVIIPGLPHNAINHNELTVHLITGRWKTIQWNFTQHKSSVEEEIGISKLQIPGHNTTTSPFPLPSIFVGLISGNNNNKDASNFSPWLYFVCVAVPSGGHLGFKGGRSVATDVFLSSPLEHIWTTLVLYSQWMHLIAPFPTVAHNNNVK